MSVVHWWLNTSFSLISFEWHEGFDYKSWVQHVSAALHHFSFANGQSSRETIKYWRYGSHDVPVWKWRWINVELMHVVALVPPSFSDSAVCGFQQWFVFLRMSAALIYVWCYCQWCSHGPFSLYIIKKSLIHCYDKAKNTLVKPVIAAAIDCFHHRCVFMPPRRKQLQPEALRYIRFILNPISQKHLEGILPTFMWTRGRTD